MPHVELRAGFFSLGTTDIWGRTITCGGCLGNCKMFRSIPGLCTHRVMTIKVFLTLQMLPGVGTVIPVPSHCLRVTRCPLEALVWFLINIDGRTSVFLGSQMPSGISEKLQTHPSASRHHVHNFDNFKELACLCLGLIP